MGGVNPYIEEAEFTPAKQKFRVTLFTARTPQGKIVEVDPAAIPYGRTGLPGSVLDIAFGAEIEIDHACGGVAACSTCHIIVREGLSSCNEMTDDEGDMLDNAPGLTPYSRLSCQTVPNGSCDLVIEVPDWNRNAVKEGP